jgi:hypothetical protein
VIRHSIILLLVGSFTLSISGAAERRASTVEVTLCDLYEHPAKYAGATVVVRATATSRMTIEDFDAHPSCSAYMRLKIALPTRGEAADRAVLVRDAPFAELLDKLQKGMNVVATFEGRFDPAFVWHDHRRTKIKVEPDSGFKDDQADGRIILRRVRDVVARPRPRR